MKSIKWEKFVSTVEGVLYNEAQVPMSNEEQHALDSFNLNESPEEQSPGPILMDKFGVITPLHQKRMPRHHYNLWLGHSNFPLTKGIDDVLIASFLGVTSFDMINPFSFRLGIGKNFDAGRVQRSIESYYQGKPWAKVMLGPNQISKFMIVSGNSRKELEEQVQLAFHDHKRCNLVIRSWDEEA